MGTRTTSPHTFVLSPLLRSLLLALAGLSAGTAAAATITVDRAGGGDFRDIQAALDAAADGDTVLVLPGVYLISEPIDFNRDLALGSTDVAPKNIVPRSVIEGFTVDGGVHTAGIESCRSARGRTRLRDAGVV